MCQGLRSAQGSRKALQYCIGQKLLTISAWGLKQVTRFAVFVTFQPQEFIITIITRVQTNISSDCELVHEELHRHAKVCCTNSAENIIVYFFFCEINVELVF